MEHGRVIGNANILDLRNATEESVKAYESIRNANLVIYTRETAHLLHKLEIGNINMTFEAPSNVKVQLMMGSLEIGTDHFANLTEPLGLLVMGPVTVAPDVPAESLDRGLAFAMVMGPISCPEPLAALVQSKAQLVMGPIRPYPLLAKMHMGSLTLDAAYLEGLNDRTELGIVGALTVPETLPSELIRKKLARLHVTGRTTFVDRNTADFQSILTGTSGRVRTIPDGFKVVDKEIEMTRDLLASITERKLYFTERVVIRDDVDESLFSGKIEGLACERTIFCPQKLQGAVAKVCDLLNTEVVAYEGELWLIDNETQLQPARFDYLNGKATLVVSGVLDVAPEVAPGVLASRLAKVHHYGVIRSTPEQRAAIESRIGVSKGVFEDPVDESDEDLGLANANYLSL